MSCSPMGNECRVRRHTYRVEGAGVILRAIVENQSVVCPIMKCFNISFKQNVFEKRIRNLPFDIGLRISLLLFYFLETHILNAHLILGLRQRQRLFLFFFC